MEMFRFSQQESPPLRSATTRALDREGPSNYKIRHRKEGERDCRDTRPEFPPRAGTPHRYAVHSNA
jgi:hypothetical protein